MKYVCEVVMCAMLAIACGAMGQQATPAATVPEPTPVPRRQNVAPEPFETTAQKMRVTRHWLETGCWVLKEHQHRTLFHWRKKCRR